MLEELLDSDQRAAFAVKNTEDHEFGDGELKSGLALIIVHIYELVTLVGKEQL